MSNETNREAFIRRMRTIADVLEQNPEIELPHEASKYASAALTWWSTTPATAHDLVKALAPLGATWIKEPILDGTYLALKQTEMPMPIGIYIPRSDVCKPVVVGTKTVQVTKTVTPAVTEVVDVEQDEIEWDCGSLLQAALAEREAAEVTA